MSTCAICLDAYDNDIVVYSCGHIFHTRCHNEAVANTSGGSNKKVLCPSCRALVTTQIKLDMDWEHIVAVSELPSSSLITPSRPLPSLILPPQRMWDCPNMPEPSVSAQGIPNSPLDIDYVHPYLLRNIRIFVSEPLHTLSYTGDIDATAAVSSPPDTTTHEFGNIIIVDMDDMRSYMNLPSSTGSATANLSIELPELILSSAHTVPLWTLHAHHYMSQSTTSSSSSSTDTLMDKNDDYILSSLPFQFEELCTAEQIDSALVSTLSLTHDIESKVTRLTRDDSSRNTSAQSTQSSYSQHSELEIALLKQQDTIESLQTQYDMLAKQSESRHEDLEMTRLRLSRLLQLQSLRRTPIALSSPLSLPSSIRPPTFTDVDESLYIQQIFYTTQSLYNHLDAINYAFSLPRDALKSNKSSRVISADNTANTKRLTAMTGLEESSEFSLLPRRKNVDDIFTKNTSTKPCTSLDSSVSSLSSILSPSSFSSSSASSSSASSSSASSSSASSSSASSALPYASTSHHGFAGFIAESVVKDTQDSMLTYNGPNMDQYNSDQKKGGGLKSTTAAPHDYQPISSKSSYKHARNLYKHHKKLEKKHWENEIKRIDKLKMQLLRSGVGRAPPRSGLTPQWTQYLQEWIKDINIHPIFNSTIVPPSMHAPYPDPSSTLSSTSGGVSQTAIPPGITKDSIQNTYLVQYSTQHNIDLFEIPLEFLPRPFTLPSSSDIIDSTDQIDTGTKNNTEKDNDKSSVSHTKLHPGGSLLRDVSDEEDGNDDDDDDDSTIAESGSKGNYDGYEDISSDQDGINKRLTLVVPIDYTQYSIFKNAYTTATLSTKSATKLPKKSTNTLTTLYNETRQAHESWSSILPTLSHIRSISQHADDNTENNNNSSSTNTMNDSSKTPSSSPPSPSSSLWSNNHYLDFLDSHPHFKPFQSTLETLNTARSHLDTYYHNLHIYDPVAYPSLQPFSSSYGHTNPPLSPRLPYTAFDTAPHILSLRYHAGLKVYLTPSESNALGLYDKLTTASLNSRTQHKQSKTQQQQQQQYPSYGSIQSPPVSSPQSHIIDDITSLILPLPVSSIITAPQRAIVWSNILSSRGFIIGGSGFDTYDWYYHLYLFFTALGNKTIKQYDNIIPVISYDGTPIYTTTSNTKHIAISRTHKDTYEYNQGTTLSEISNLNFSSLDFLLHDDSDQLSSSSSSFGDDTSTSNSNMNDDNTTNTTTATISTDPVYDIDLITELTRYTHIYTHYNYIRGLTHCHKLKDTPCLPNEYDTLYNTSKLKSILHDQHEQDKLRSLSYKNLSDNADIMSQSSSSLSDDYYLLLSQLYNGITSIVSLSSLSHSIHKLYIQHTKENRNVPVLSKVYDYVLKSSLYSPVMPSHVDYAHKMINHFSSFDDSSIDTKQVYSPVVPPIPPPSTKNKSKQNGKYDKIHTLMPSSPPTVDNISLLLAVLDRTSSLSPYDIVILYKKIISSRPLSSYSTVLPSSSSDVLPVSGHLLVSLLRSCALNDSICQCVGRIYSSASLSHIPRSISPPNTNQNSSPFSSDVAHQPPSTSHSHQCDCGNLSSLQNAMHTWSSKLVNKIVPLFQHSLLWKVLSQQHNHHDSPDQSLRDRSTSFLTALQQESAPFFSAYVEHSPLSLHTLPSITMQSMFPFDPAHLRAILIDNEIITRLSLTHSYFASILSYIGLGRPFLSISNASIRQYFPHLDASSHKSHSSKTTVPSSDDPFVIFPNWLYQGSPRPYLLPFVSLLKAACFTCLSTHITALIGHSIYVHYILSLTRMFQDSISPLYAPTDRISVSQYPSLISSQVISHYTKFDSILQDFPVFALDLPLPLSHYISSQSPPLLPSSSAPAASESSNIIIPCPLFIPTTFIGIDTHYEIYTRWCSLNNETDMSISDSSSAPSSAPSSSSSKRQLSRIHNHSLSPYVNLSLLTPRIIHDTLDAFTTQRLHQSYYHKRLRESISFFLYRVGLWVNHINTRYPGLVSTHFPTSSSMYTTKPTSKVSIALGLLDFAVPTQTTMKKQTSKRSTKTPQQTTSIPPPLPSSLLSALASSFSSESPLGSLFDGTNGTKSKLNNLSTPSSISSSNSSIISRSIALTVGTICFDVLSASVALIARASDSMLQRSLNSTKLWRIYNAIVLHYSQFDRKYDHTPSSSSSMHKFPRPDLTAFDLEPSMNNIVDIMIDLESINKIKNIQYNTPQDFYKGLMAYLRTIYDNKTHSNTQYISHINDINSIISQSTIEMNSLYIDPTLQETVSTTTPAAATTKAKAMTISPPLHDTHNDTMLIQTKFDQFRHKLSIFSTIEPITLPSSNTTSLTGNESSKNTSDELLSFNKSDNITFRIPSTTLSPEISTNGSNSATLATLLTRKLQARVKNRRKASLETSSS